MYFSENKTLLLFFKANTPQPRYIRSLNIAPTPPLKVASDSWVCVKGEVCHLFQLAPLRGFGGLPNKCLAIFPLFRHTPP